MGRFPQSQGERGSLKWVQCLANECPELINSALRNVCMVPYDAQIAWLSPIRADKFAEYRDQAFVLDVFIDVTQIEKAVTIENKE